MLRNVARRAAVPRRRALPTTAGRASGILTTNGVLDPNSWSCSSGGLFGRGGRVRTRSFSTSSAGSTTADGRVVTSSNSRCSTTTPSARRLVRLPNSRRGDVPPPSSFPPSYHRRRSQQELSTAAAAIAAVPEDVERDGGGIHHPTGGQKNDTTNDGGNHLPPLPAYGDTHLDVSELARNRYYLVETLSAVASNTRKFDDHHPFLRGGHPTKPIQIRVQQLPIQDSISPSGTRGRVSSSHPLEDPAGDDNMSLTAGGSMEVSQDECVGGSAGILDGGLGEDEEDITSGTCEEEDKTGHSEQDNDNTARTSPRRGGKGKFQKGWRLMDLSEFSDQDIISQLDKVTRPGGIRNGGLHQRSDRILSARTLRIFHESIKRDVELSSDLYVRLMSFFAQRRKLIDTYDVFRRYRSVYDRQVEEGGKEVTAGVMVEGEEEEVVDGSEEGKQRTTVHNVVVPLEARGYRILCDAIGESEDGEPDERIEIMDFLFSELPTLPVDTHQRLCYPRFLLALCKSDYITHSRWRTTERGQSRAGIPRKISPGFYASRVHHRMLDERYECLEDSTYYQEVLKSTSLRLHASTPKGVGIPMYLRTDRMLKRLVEDGHRPSGKVVMTTLHNLYPFTGQRPLFNVLSAIATLRRDTVSGTEEERWYQVDLGTLDRIAMEAGRGANPELVVLVLDVAESMGYPPTTTMYESAVLAFFWAGRRDQHAMAVLDEMEQRGHEVSRALIRTVSDRLCDSPQRITNLLYLLKNGTEGATMSTSSLNCVLAASARGGWVDQAFTHFAEFSNSTGGYGTYDETSLRPNVDSYSYLLEALRRNILAIVREESGNVRPQAGRGGIHTEPRSDHGLEELLDSAEGVLDMMANDGVPLSRHVVENYVVGLAYAGEVRKATDFLRDVRKNRDAWMGTNERVLESTYTQLIKQCAFREEMAMANEVLGMAREEGHRPRLPISVKEKMQLFGDKNAGDGSSQGMEPSLSEFVTGNVTIVGDSDDAGVRDSDEHLEEKGFSDSVES